MKHCFALLCLLLPTTFLAAQETASDKPLNVVLIISDDQAWTDYGFMGHEAIQTPSLDRLASEGIVYTRGYVPTALCRPSLMTLATGLYAHQHKVSGNDPARTVEGEAYTALREQLKSHIDTCDTLPEQLGRAGYLSMQSGKWWEGAPARGGFTHGMTHGDPKRGGRHGDVGLKIGREGMEPVEAFIDEAVEANKPFFLWYAPFMPHTPHNPPERLLKKYAVEGRDLKAAKYFAMCEWFDETCGQLLNYLDEQGLAENTLIVYVTDNGWITRTSDMDVPASWGQAFAPKSKQSPYEGGTRTPIMLRLPGKIEPRRDEETLVSSVDLVPTILAACGVEPSSELAGVSLMPNAVADEPIARDTIYGEGFAHDVADIDNPTQSLLYRWCIEGRWKLLLAYNGKVGRYAPVHAYGEHIPQLFDLQSDPTETKNLASEHPEIVKRLMEKIDAWYDVPDAMLVRE